MQDRSVVTINNILEAARSLFIEKQYADVTLKELAEAAGVTKGALYHHFPAKEDLYLSMMHHFLAEVKESTQAVVDNTRGHYCRERLYQSLLGFLQLPEETLNLVRLVRRDINIFQDSVRRELIRAYQVALPEPLEAVIAEGIVQGEVIEADARLLSWQYVALVEVSIRPYGRQMLGQPHAMAEFLVTMLFEGIEAKK
jgi:AcrR family transcriptional regulator